MKVHFSLIERIMVTTDQWSVVEIILPCRGQQSWLLRSTTALPKIDQNSPPLPSLPPTHTPHHPGWGSERQAAKGLQLLPLCSCTPLQGFPARRPGGGAVGAGRQSHCLSLPFCLKRRVRKAWEVQNSFSSQTGHRPVFWAD